ncbi:hypothetical protein B0H13DRAFT_2316345 [Mycena leptocephala]|nr:hypothetical protein B0H13DRAFT_2316345 [Mycena leptocephala]
MVEDVRQILVRLPSVTSCEEMMGGPDMFGQAMLIAILIRRRCLFVGAMRGPADELFYAHGATDASTYTNPRVPIPWQVVSVDFASAVISSNARSAESINMADRPAPKQSAIPALDSTLGAIQVGGVVSTYLFGIETLQAYYYFRKFRADSVWLKVMVAVVWLLELQFGMRFIAPPLRFMASHSICKDPPLSLEMTIFFSPIRTIGLTVDIVVTLAMCYWLRKISNTKFSRTKDIADALLMWAVGVATSTGSTMLPILFLSRHDANLEQVNLSTMPKAGTIGHFATERSQRMVIEMSRMTETDADTLSKVAPH